MGVKYKPSHFLRAGVSTLAEQGGLCKTGLTGRTAAEKEKGFLFSLGLNTGEMSPRLKYFSATVRFRFREHELCMYVSDCHVMLIPQTFFRDRDRDPSCIKATVVF